MRSIHAIPSQLEKSAAADLIGRFPADDSFDWAIPGRSGKVGKGISPEEWHDMLDEGDATVLDCRNS